MFKFAHMADIHIGAHKDKRLMELEIQAFNESIDICIKEGVKFIIIAGDFFDKPIPELEQVKKIIKKLIELSQSNIPVYVIYGSHDYSPGQDSMIDLLEAAKLIIKIYNPKSVDGKIRLEMYQDKETGVKLAGISARKVGLEKAYFEKLDREHLENQDGFKIFVFHSGIEEFKPSFLKGAMDMECIPINWFPKGFNYYAGGHIHKRDEFNIQNYQNIIFPGPSFIGWGTKDYTDVAKGEKRGFYIVSCEDNKIIENGIKFVEIKKIEGNFIEFDVTGKRSKLVNDEINKKLEEEEVDNKLVVIRIFGELLSGNTSDIDTIGIRKSLTDRNAISPQINRNKLSTKELQKIRISSEDKLEIEDGLFRENVINIKSENKLLQNKNGIMMAKELLRVLKESPKDSNGKNSTAIQNKIVKSGIETLEIAEIMEE
ncbi:MAG: double-stranded DNA repair protein Mre11 [Thaumarchaeota archaeon]|nr:double-stranded DNA repair protein Mre11 [Nitrososphaerota archaeon]